MEEVLRVSTDPTASTAVLDPLTRPAAEPRPGADPREARGIPRPVRFGALLVQLALLLVVFRAFHLETPAFLVLAAVAFAGFAVHYWLPFRFKEHFTIGLSIAAAYLILSPVAATLLFAVGLALFGVAASRVQYRWKVAVIVAAGAALMVGRVIGVAFVPPQFWPVFGAIFMFG